MTSTKAIVAGLMSLMLASPVFAQTGGGAGSINGTIDVQNQVGNLGNASGTSAFTTGRGNNTNQNNNQNYTGVNYNGYLGYTGDPSAIINSGGNQIVNFQPLGLPGILGPPGNFSQPYKPDVWLNGAGVVRPARLSYAQAEDCVRGYGHWGVDTAYIGKKNGNPARAIDLVYPAWDEVKPTNDISALVGISTVSADEKPWLPAICKAAMQAMDGGANFGVVEFVVKPKNKFKGFGFGSSAGASGTPNALSTGPYALAGVGGFGIGWSSQEVVGRVMIQLTGLTKSPSAAQINSRGAVDPKLASSDTKNPVIAMRSKEPVKPPEGRSELLYGGSGVTPKPPASIEPSGLSVVAPPAAKADQPGAAVQAALPPQEVPQAAMPQLGRGTYDPRGGSDFGAK